MTGLSYRYYRFLQLFIYIYVYMMKFHSRTEKDVPQPVRLVARQIYDKQCDKHDREYDTPVASLLPLHARTASFRVRLSLIIRWREMLHSSRDGEEKSIRYLRFPRSSNEFTKKSILTRYARRVYIDSICKMRSLTKVRDANTRIHRDRMIDTVIY